jgi:Protein of unknown function (DUF2877)
VIAQVVAAPVVGRRVEAPYGDDDGFVTVVVPPGGPLLPNGVVLTGPVERGPVVLDGAEVWDPTIRLAHDPGLAPDPSLVGRDPEAIGGELIGRDPEAIGAELIGRGPGLTPEGDDVVAGLAAVVASGPWPAAAKTAWLRALIGDDLRRRTTALSATLLELAARGLGPEPLQALLAGRPGALDRLQRLGHTSGRAYARGAAVGLSVIRGR